MNPASKVRSPYAVVIGMQSMNGLQTARLFWRRGIPVIGIGRAGHPYLRTRACERVIPVPTADSDVIAVLEELGPSLDERAVLVPCIDQMVMQLSLHRERLTPWYHMVLPEHKLVEALVDKAQFCSLAQQHGLPIPPTVIVRSQADAERAAEELTFPCVLKPAYKPGSWTRETLTRGYRLRTPDELRERFAQVASWADTLIVQQWIGGGEENLFTCNAYFDAASRPVATFVSQKLRQWPPVTGMGSLGIECDNEAVARITVNLFQAVGYRGLAYLEMKRAPDTDRYLVIEPNVGRPTGRSALAEACGVELLAAMYCDTVGLPLPEQLEQRHTGMKWMHLRYDLQAALSAWSRRQLTLREWLRSVRGRKIYADFSWKDPAPFWLDVLRVIGLTIRPSTRHQHLSERVQ